MKELNPVSNKDTESLSFEHTSNLTIVILKSNETSPMFEKQLFSQSFNLSNCQLIIISQEKSSNCFSMLKKKYSIENIVSESIVNGLNEALNIANGKYTVFLKDTDVFSKNYLKRMFAYSEQVNPDNNDDSYIDDEDEEEENEILEKLQDIPPIPLICPQHTNSKGDIDRFSSGKKVVGVDLRQINSPTIKFPLTIFGCFIKTEILKKYQFHMFDIFYISYMDLIMRILLDYRLFLSVDKISFTCASENRTLDNANIFANWLLPFIKRNAKPHSKKIPVFFQAFALQIIDFFINDYSSDNQEPTKKECEEFWKTIKCVLSFIDDNTIDRVLNGRTNYELSKKYNLYRIKYNATIESYNFKEANEILYMSLNEKKAFVSQNNLPFTINNIIVDKNTIYIEGETQSIYENPSLSIFININNERIPLNLESFNNKRNIYKENLFDYKNFSIQHTLNTKSKILVLFFEIKYSNKYFSIPLDMNVKSKQKFQYNNDLKSIIIKIKK